MWLHAWCFFEVTSTETNWNSKHLGIRFCLTEWVAEKKKKTIRRSHCLSVSLLCVLLCYLEPWLWEEELTNIGWSWAIGSFVSAKHWAVANYFITALQQLRIHFKICQKQKILNKSLGRITVVLPLILETNHCLHWCFEAKGVL